MEPNQHIINIQLELILVFLIFISLGCEKYLNISFDQKEPKLVVNSMIMPDSIFTVYVGKTIDLSQQFSDDFISEKNVVCSLFVNNSFREVLLEKGNKYISSIALYPTPNNLYKLKIYDPELGTAQAETFIPMKTKLSNVSLSINNYSSPVGDFQPEIYSTVYLSIDDDVNTHVFYEVYITQYGKNQHYGVYDTLFMEDIPLYIFTNNIEMNTVETGNSVLFSDSSFNGQKKTFAFHVSLMWNRAYENIHYLKNMKIHLRTVSADYVKYKESIEYSYSTIYGGNDNPVTVFSNINGALGIFLGYNDDVDSSTFPISLDSLL